MKPYYYLVRYQCNNGLIVEQSHENEKQACKAAANLSQSHAMVFSCEVFDTDNNPCLGLVTKWIGGKSGEIVNRNMQPLEPLDKTQRRIKPMAKTVDTTKTETRGRPVTNATAKEQSTETNTKAYRQSKKSATPPTRATRADGVTHPETTIGGEAVPNSTLADEKKALKKADPKLKPTKVAPSKTEHEGAKRPAKIAAKLEKIDDPSPGKFARLKAPAKLRKLSAKEAKEVDSKIARRAGTQTDDVCKWFSARLNTPIALADIGAQFGTVGDTNINNIVSIFKRLSAPLGIQLSSEKKDGIKSRMFFLA